MKENERFGSLDVVNLYGSIPLTGPDNVYDVLQSYFADNCHLTAFQDLQLDDFAVLLRLALESDSVTIGGSVFKQTQGVAMGSNFSPDAAIIYMDFIERQVLQDSRTRIWSRFVDDIFFVTTETYEAILAKANSIHPAIQFTFEEPRENRLPYLDLLLSLNPDGKFSFSLYVKPIHSGHMLPANSHVPESRKFSLLVAELRRAKRCSSDGDSLKASVEIVEQRFRMNGYTDTTIKRAKKVAYATPRTPRPPTSRVAPIYVKVPFVDDQQAAQTRKAAKQTGLPISVTFINRKPLGQILRKPIPPPCPANCTCDGKQLCLKKNVIYDVSCKLCNNERYAGESGRTYNRRMLEHTTQEQSQVYQHFNRCHRGQDVRANVDMQILATGFEDTNHRQAFETSHLNSTKPSMNCQHST